MRDVGCWMLVLVVVSVSTYLSSYMRHVRFERSLHLRVELDVFVLDVGRWCWCW